MDRTNRFDEAGLLVNDETATNRDMRSCDRLIRICSKERPHAAWRQTAEFISKYFSKGASICIVGSIQTRNYTANDGSKRYVTEVLADEAMFVDSKAEADNSRFNNNVSSAPKYMPEGYAEAEPEQAGIEEDSESDLPF